MTLFGSEGGKAMLVGLGKEDDADIHAYRKAGRRCCRRSKEDARNRSYGSFLWSER